jgi:hypothetical protein
LTDSESGEDDDDESIELEVKTDLVKGAPAQ